MSRQTITVQVDGKIRGQMTFDDRDWDSRSFAQSEGRKAVSAFIDGQDRRVVRTVYADGIVNFVTRPSTAVK